VNAGAAGSGPARRAFVGGIAGGLLVWPFTGLAQQSKGAPRIGVLGNTVGAPAYEAFLRALRSLGYTEGRNIAFEWRWAEGKAERFPDLAIELIQLKVDLIVATSTQATLAARRATGTVPIVMAASAYPDRIGLVESLAHPGGNVTGMSNVAPELAGKRLELLKSIAPDVRRVAALWNPAIPVEPYAMREMQAGAAEIGVQILPIAVVSRDDYAAAFGAVIAGRADALAAFGNPLNFRNQRLIADFALKNHLPSSYDEKAFVEAGGLLSYAPSFIDLFGRAARFVDKILKGAKPSDLPIQQPTTFEFMLNARTAKALGLTIPGSLMMRADKVIE
jgi:putative ABC transport system substrate-binding protein